MDAPVAASEDAVADPLPSRMISTNVTAERAEVTTPVAPRVEHGLDLPALCARRCHETRIAGVSTCVFIDAIARRVRVAGVP